MAEITYSRKKPNPWNSLVAGGLLGGARYGSALVEQAGENETRRLYKQAVDRLGDLITAYSNGQPKQVEQPPIKNESTITPQTTPQTDVTGGDPSVLPPIPNKITAQPVGVDDKGNVNPLRPTKTGYEITAIPPNSQDILKKFFNYSNRLSRRGDYGKQSAKDLAGYFSGMINDPLAPEYDYFNTSLGVVKINKKTGEAAQITENPKKISTKFIPGITPIPVEKNGKYYLKYTYIRSDGENEEPYQKEVEVDYDTYDMYKTQQGNKSVSYEEMREDRRMDKLSSRIGRSIGGLGSILANLFTPNESADYSKFKRFNELSRNYNHLSEAEMKEYKEKQMELTSSLDVSWEQLNKLLETTQNAPNEKMAKKMFDDMKNNYGKRNKEYTAKIQKDITDLKSQYDSGALKQKIRAQFESQGQQLTDGQLDSAVEQLLANTVNDYITSMEGILNQDQIAWLKNEFNLLPKNP